MPSRAALPSVLVACLASAACALNSGPDCPGCPPPIGTMTEGGLPDAPPVPPGPCPGSGTVTVAFDRAAASQTCWSAQNGASFSGMIVPGAPAVILSGIPQSTPGLSVHVLLYEGRTNTALCSVGKGTMVPLSGPCLVVSVEYGATAGVGEWSAYAGSTTSVGSAAVGALEVNELGLSSGATVDVTFAPGASVVLDVPGNPLVSISGSVRATLE